MKILISPFSRKLRNGDKNAKNYPFWDEVVHGLRDRNMYSVQVGSAGEPYIGADQVFNDLTMMQLKELLDQMDLWISVDNFFNHFASYYGRKGIVIFGRSDPDIFGYPENVNLLKDRSYLRPDQFGLWETIPFSSSVFVDPSVVIDAVAQLGAQTA